MHRLPRGYRPGGIGRIVGLHADQGSSFEAKAGREFAAHCKSNASERDGHWSVGGDKH